MVRSETAESHTYVSKNTPAEPVRIPQSYLNIVTLSCVSAGVIALLPVPFVDDMLIRRVHRKMSTELFEEAGIKLDSSSAKHLSETESSFFGGLFNKALMYPIKKVLKKVLFVFSIKSATDVASAVFHDGWLLSRVLTTGDILDKQALESQDKDLLDAIRAAQMSTYQEINIKPINRLMSKGFEEAKDLVLSAVSNLDEQVAESDPKDRIVDQAKAQDDVSKVADQINPQQDLEDAYLAKLDRTFTKHLKASLTDSAA